MKLSPCPQARVSAASRRLGPTSAVQISLQLQDVFVLTAPGGTEVHQEGSCRLFAAWKDWVLGLRRISSWVLLVSGRRRSLWGADLPGATAMALECVVRYGF